MKAEFALQKLHTALQDLYRDGYVLYGELHLTKPAVKGMVVSEVTANFVRHEGSESVGVMISTRRPDTSLSTLIEDPLGPQDTAHNVIAAAEVVEQTSRFVPPNPVELLAASQQSDAPTCLTCGSLTVRSGTCYKCLNCGASLGCS